MRTTICTAVFCLLAGWTLASLPNPVTNEAQAQKAALGKMMLVTTAFGTSWGFVRYNTSTGETWEASGADFKKYEEAGPIPAGDFEVQAIASGTTRVVTRIEKNSGRTWYLSSNKFVEMKEPAKPQ